LVIFQSNNLKLTLEGESTLKFTDIFHSDSIVIPRRHLMLPVVGDIVMMPESVQTETDELGITLCYQFKQDLFKNYRVRLTQKGRYFELSASFQAAKSCMLNGISILPENTIMNLHKVLNYRNQHCTEQTYPDFVLGDEIDTTTYSSDWQFAPHPSMYTFTKNDCNVILGALTLPKSFGLDLKAEGYKLEKLTENYGAGEHGLKLQEGEEFNSTVFAIYADYFMEPEQSVKRHSELLVEEKYIPNPKAKKRYPWHRENLYCTWIDQGYLSDTVIPNDLHKQIEITLDAGKAVSDEMVRKAVEIIEREKLPFTTILIDMGWAVRGEWIADPARFPDFRGLVDFLHDKGFKVVVWWNWAEVDNDADIEPQFMVDSGAMNKHNQRTIDFSNPKTQGGYFKPLFRRLFSDEEGCYNTDGVKTDFLSDKIYPEINLYDSSWRGEENYFYKIFKMFYEEMRFYKPDAVHIGCAGHPYLAQFIDINRTYDIWSTNPLEHVNRGNMLKATSIGVPVAYDFHHFTDNLELYLQYAVKNNCSVQIGNIMGVKDYPVSAWHETDKKYFDILRTYLPLLPRKNEPCTGENADELRTDRG